MQNALQLGADTFVEQYSVETDVNAVTPPNTGWKKTVSIQAKERHANGALWLTFLFILPPSNLFYCLCHVYPLFRNTQTSLF